jgi:hypothetical protein
VAPLDTTVVCAAAFDAAVGAGALRGPTPLPPQRAAVRPGLTGPFLLRPYRTRPTAHLLPVDSRRVPAGPNRGRWSWCYFFLVRVAPPRPRSVTPVSLSTRCTNP